MLELIQPLETADIALMSDDLSKLPYTIKLSRKALAIIKQNITFSLAIKVAGFTVSCTWLVNVMDSNICRYGSNINCNIKQLTIAKSKRIESYVKGIAERYPFL